MNKLDYSKVFPPYITSYKQVKPGETFWVDDTREGDTQELWKIIDNNVEERWFSYEILDTKQKE
jgi:hypothetical protein